MTRTGLDRPELWTASPTLERGVWELVMNDAEARRFYEGLRRMVGGLVECEMKQLLTQHFLRASLLEPEPVPERGEETFRPFAKVPRLRRAFTVTEKIDGTNAQVVVLPDGRVLAGARSRYLSVEQDNHGFAQWVASHEDELRTGLGPGRHYGEWWGQGINRGYGLEEKRFSLFNTSRWAQKAPPACCHVVPVLAQEPDFLVEGGQVVLSCLAALRTKGSVAAPGFMDPEGVVVFHAAANALFKATCKNDERRKTE